MELHHRTSQCEKCGYGTGSALTPSVSQDRALSELVARLHAAEVAAEVEVEGLQPNRILLTDSGSSSDKSATGVTAKKVESTTEQPTTATDPVQQHSQTDPKGAYKSTSQPQFQGPASTKIPIHRAMFSSYDGSTPSYNTDDFPTKPCKASPSSQPKTSYALSHNRESPIGLDGSLEEAESSRPRTLKRLRTPREKPPGQVASRIRELELKNAIPMPKHFRPAGHTRHDHNRDSGNHRSQLHRDEKPNVDLIFPLRVHCFPRRDASGAPVRPETPLHRSVPEEEPIVHSPQPARSMPMLKDPPEHDSHTTPKPEIVNTSCGKPEEEPHTKALQPAQSMPTLKDPPEYDSHPSPKPATLDTSRGNQDGFAVASGHGRRPPTAALTGATKDMVERSRSGAYIPVGKVYRSQLEATSPWSFAERAKRLHAEVVCPDCAAEQSLKRHASAKAREDILQAASHFHGAPPHTSSPGPPSTTSGDLVSVAAVEMITDTGAIVVVQHEGVLDRVATDPRRGPLTRASSQRLSENLAKVSKAVAQLDSVDEHPVQINTDIDRLEPSPLRPRKVKSCSMSELLDELHAIAASMNIDISGPVKRESFAQGQSYIAPVGFPFTSFDTEGLLSEPTTQGAMPVEPGHVAEAADEIPFTRMIRPEQSQPHFENPESLLSEPTSPSPMSDEALAKAIAEHIRSQKPDNKSRSPPSVYVTALPTRNNSIPEPVPLPSSIFRATDFSSNAALKATQRPSSSLVVSSISRLTPHLAPGQYPSSPHLSSPWSVRSPKPIKRVRTMNRWPPEHDISSSPGSETSESDQAHIATELHRAAQEVAARERELHKAVREAAEMERGLRRMVMMSGRKGGVSKGQK
ncbi:hypothetical protein MBLNU13_g04044t4 [Cladosporium sp. NU13]